MSETGQAGGLHDTLEAMLRDLRPGIELTGPTELQARLAAGLLLGLNQTEAARVAGYQGEGAALRSTASQAARSSPVLALLSWAESQGKGVPDSPGDREELVRILWRHARSKDKAFSIKASEALERIHRTEEAEKEPVRDPKEILNEIAEIDVLFAAKLAAREGFFWKPPGDWPLCPHCGQVMRRDAPVSRGRAANGVVDGRERTEARP